MKKMLLALGLVVVFPGLSFMATAAEITVSAASSLTDAFKAVAADYQNRYPDAKVALNFGASGALFQQMAKGAPVDVFASADQKTMNQANTAGLLAAGQRHDFVQNSLVLIVPKNSSLTLKQLSDLRQDGIKRISNGNPDTTPAGRYAQRALEAAGLSDALKDKIVKTQNVRQSLDYVARGEVDVGFVFGTDAARMPDKVAIAFVVPLKEAILYPIAVTTNPKPGSPTAKEAQRFVAYLLSDEGQAILVKFGFARP